eukprot:scaffold13052_cov63-Phaeocystis_antarctica.AAC.1
MASVPMTFLEIIIGSSTKATCIAPYTLGVKVRVRPPASRRRRARGAGTPVAWTLKAGGIGGFGGGSLKHPRQWLIAQWRGGSPRGHRARQSHQARRVVVVVAAVERAAPQVCIALLPDVGGLRSVPVARVDGVDHVHAPHDPTKGHDARVVQLVVVIVVDQQLRAAPLRAASRAARREGDGAPHVPVLVLDGALLLEHLPVPVPLQGDVPAQTELNQEAWHHPVERTPGEKVAVDELLEAPGGDRRLGLAHGHQEAVPALRRQGDLKLDCVLQTHTRAQAISGPVCVGWQWVRLASEHLRSARGAANT